MDEISFRTSGSTGVAKSIVRTEASLQADAALLVRSFPGFWKDRPTVVASIPEDHMYGALWRVRAPAKAGCSVAPDTVLSAEGLVDAFSRHGRFLFVTTPSFLEKLLLHPEAGSLRGAFVGIVTSGSLLRKETALAAAELFETCPTEIFGSTETGTVASRRRIEGDEWTLVDSVSARTTDDGRLEVDAPHAMMRPFVMSDAVTFSSSRRFLLKGRTDRRVKILETFVSLPEVEAALESHPLVVRAGVEAFGDDVPRLGALLVLSEEAKRRLVSGSCSSLVAELRRDLLLRLGPAAFPRRIRFVRTVPVNERGKTTASDVRAELTAWCREPVTTAWTQTATSLAAKWVFPADLECFSGHFPGFPVLPGVAQLYFLRHFARQAFPDWPDATTYRRLKFQKMVLPGQEVSVSVERREAGVFSFSIVGAHGPCSSGLVEEQAT